MNNDFSDLSNGWKALCSKLLRAVLLGLFCLGGISTAQAGRACGEWQPTPTDVRNGLSLAHKVRTALDASGAELAIIARAGQDLSKYGLNYSHAAFVVRARSSVPEKTWLNVHLLNQCGTAKAELFHEGLGNFFLDDMFRYEALVVIPPPALQAALLAQLSDASGAGAMPAMRFFEPHYNMLAYTYATKYQNSNQWVLETLAAAMAGPSVQGRAQAQAWLKTAGFAPITLQISTLTRLGGRVTRANIAFDDHPNERRFANKIDTVTVDALVNFLQQREPASKRLEIKL